MDNAKNKGILELDISELFGFAEMSDEEKADLLENIGSVITESSTLRYVTEAPPEQVELFEKFLEEHGEEEDVLVKLIETFPDFENILTEEIAAFKSEAQQILKHT